MTIPQPKRRSQVRKLLGREYFILKRKFSYLRSDVNWASTYSPDKLAFEVFSHKSLVLRKLAGIDMRLQENKRRNLELAINHLNGLLIKPGETFSLWKLVGRPSKRKGYLSGLVLESGRVAEGTGGGLCQLGNLLFWVFIHTPLEIVERHRHGFDVFPDVKRKVPFGAGATLAYNYIDLMVKNNSEGTFQLNLWLDQTHLNGHLTCDEDISDRYEIEEVNHHIKHQHWGGYSRHNQILQRITTPEGEVFEKIIIDNHAIMMYEPLLSDK